MIMPAKLERAQRGHNHTEELSVGHIETMS
jgi:hypothetical protein